MQTWMLFVIGAVLAWGSYGPLIHNGQIGLGSAVRAFLCVGGAYFLTAVVIPLGVLMMQNEPGAFTARGVGWATFAGIAGAMGAICVIFAFRTGAAPIYVMPLVFGGAPIVNALVSMALHPPKQAPSVWFFVGCAVAGLGAWMVLRFKPA